MNTHKEYNINTKEYHIKKYGKLSDYKIINFPTVEWDIVYNNIAIKNGKFKCPNNPIIIFMLILRDYDKFPVNKIKVTKDDILRAIDDMCLEYDNSEPVFHVGDITFKKDTRLYYYNPHILKEIMMPDLRKLI